MVQAGEAAYKQGRLPIELTVLCAAAARQTAGPAGLQTQICVWAHASVFGCDWIVFGLSEKCLGLGRQ